MLQNTQPARRRPRVQQQQQQQQQQPQQQGPEQLQDEAAWTMLLQHMLEYSKAQQVTHVARKLLSCSQVMASLVHGVCAGRLEVFLSLPVSWGEDDSLEEAEDGIQASCQEVYSAARWLAKHAQLVHTLRQEDMSDDTLMEWDIPGAQAEDVQTEDALAAGLSAASGRQMLSSRRLTRSRASEAQALAAVSAGTVSTPFQQGLLLREVDVRSGTGSILSCLRGLTQLTSLTVHLYSPTVAAAWQQTIPTLVGLQQLAICLERSCGRPAFHDKLVPPLQHLTQLTKLSLGNHFPSDAMLQQLQTLPALEEVSLIHRGYSFMHNDPTRSLSLKMPHLARLPLASLALADVHCLSSDLEPLHQCSRLTSLVCSAVHLGDSLQQLSEQLQRLPTLQHFSWDGSSSSSVLQEPAADNARVFLQGFTRMPALRDLNLESVRLGSVALELLAATQLQQLKLYACRIDSATAAALKSTLAACKRVVW